MVRSLLFLIVALVAVLVTGCAAPASSAPGVNTPVATPVATSGGSAGESAGQSPLATPGTGASPVGTPAGGSAAISPDVAASAVTWLAGQANVSAANLRLVKAEQVEWTDSCFGLGGPAESCLQAITPGWRITFEANGQQYEVRTDQSGSSFRVAPQAS